MKKTVFSALALAAIVTLPQIAQAQDFDGPSIGVQGGYVETKLRNPNTILGQAPIDSSKDAAVIGGFIGYDKSFNKFVLGVEAGFSGAIEDTINGGTAANQITVDPKWSFDATVRAGYLVNPKTLVYARGGYANERIDTRITTATGVTSASENRDGWLVGGGVERLITDHVSARIEYRYTDFSEGDGKFDRHQALIGVAYRF